MIQFFYYNFLFLLVLIVQIHATEHSFLAGISEKRPITHFVKNHTASHLRHKGMKIIKNLENSDAAEMNTKNLETLQTICKKLKQIKASDLGQTQNQKRDIFLQKTEHFFQKEQPAPLESESAKHVLVNDFLVDSLEDLESYDDVSLVDFNSEHQEIFPEISLKEPIVSEITQTPVLPRAPSIILPTSEMVDAPVTVPAPVTIPISATIPAPVTIPVPVVFDYKVIIQKQSHFFSEHIRHRFIRLGIVFTLNYLKAIYQQYKKNPKFKKVVILRNALKTMPRQKSFIISTILGLVLPKMPFE